MAYIDALGLLFARFMLVRKDATTMPATATAPINTKMLLLLAISKGVRGVKAFLI